MFRITFWFQNKIPIFTSTAVFLGSAISRCSVFLPLVLEDNLWRSVAQGLLWTRLTHGPTVISWEFHSLITHLTSTSEQCPVSPTFQYGKWARSWNFWDTFTKTSIMPLLLWFTSCHLTGNEHWEDLLLTCGSELLNLIWDHWSSVSHVNGKRWLL